MSGISPVVTSVVVAGPTSKTMQAPVPLDDATRRRLVRQRRSDTTVELRLRQLLHRAGLRYFVDRPLREFPRVRPDVVFPRPRIAVFVDGCFWHACPQHGTAPKNNAAWWSAKLAANVERDRRIAAMLTERGWLVLRFWEHELPEAMARMVFDAVKSRRGQPVAQRR